MSSPGESPAADHLSYGEDNKIDITALLIFIGFCILIFTIAKIIVEIFQWLYGGQILVNGLDSRSLDALPVITYQKTDPEKNNECSICISALEDGESVREMPVCKHLFHKDCIDRWLQNHVTCPICRAIIEPLTRSSASAPVREPASSSSSSSDYVSVSISQTSISVSRLVSGSDSRSGSSRSTSQGSTTRTPIVYPIRSNSQTGRRVDNMV
ncbi:hypothetical protein LUZ60_012518 [Juncus effusus]|nr:hypothetical protein LUZ60_012518 [Juncus effusus]